MITQCIRFNSCGSHHALGIAPAILLVVATTMGCGMFGSGESKQPLSASSRNMAGEGTVTAKVGDNGNTDVEVRVKHLAPPSKLASDASTYVVWLQPRNSAIQNLGALEVDDNLMGTFDTTTPHRSFRLIITPEPSARMSEPSHDPVFTSEVVASK
jgi:hypothetical protein